LACRPGKSPRHKNKTREHPMGTDNAKQGSTFASPSGRYKITITQADEGWGRSIATIRTATGITVLHTVERNYPTFWYLFVEDHKVTGHDYLLCGEDYQGYTVIDLTKGSRVDYLPPEAKQGHGWCVADMVLESDGITLRAEGCYWACPYEYRFFDFSDPTKVTADTGLPNMLPEGEMLDLLENSVVRFADDGSLVWEHFVRRFKETGEWESDVEHLFHSKFSKALHMAKQAGDDKTVAELRAEQSAFGGRYWPDDDDEEEALWERVLDHARIFRPVVGDDGARSFVEDTEAEFKSPRLLESEARGAKAKAERDAVFQRFKDSDPIYGLVKAEWPDDHDNRTGRMYQSLVSQWDGDDNPFYFTVRVHGKRDLSDPVAAKRPTATLKWGAEKGGIVVDAWTYGVGSRKSDPFPRTAEGFTQALQYARSHVDQGGAA